MISFGFYAGIFMEEPKKHLMHGAGYHANRLCVSRGNRNHEAGHEDW